MPLPAGVPDAQAFAACHQLRELWHMFLDQVSFKAFIEVVLEPSPRLGVASLMMGSGIGGLKPNTLVLAFDEGAAAVGAGAATYPTSAMELTSNSVYDPKVLFFPRVNETFIQAYLSSS